MGPPDACYYFAGACQLSERGDAQLRWALSRLLLLPHLCSSTTRRWFDMHLIAWGRWFHSSACCMCACAALACTDMLCRWTAWCSSHAGSLGHQWWMQLSKQLIIVFSTRARHHVKVVAVLPWMNTECINTCTTPHSTCTFRTTHAQTFHSKPRWPEADPSAGHALRARALIPSDLSTGCTDEWHAFDAYHQSQMPLPMHGMCIAGYIYVCSTDACCSADTACSDANRALSVLSSSS